MTSITFNRVCFEVGGQPAFLYSGEFHYFRVPKKDWKTRMRLFKEAGGNCIATYIPWLIHEPEEGRFAFHGQGGILDFEDFLQAAQDCDLAVAARPGPYQYSELVYSGLPRWLCEGYPELRAKTINGKDIDTGSISYVHPLFLDKVRRWFDVVCPIIAKATVSRGGPVALTQFDNELTGVQIWMGSVDYNAAAMGFGQVDGRYPRFLRARHGDIATLNRRYGTDFGAFEEVRPIAAKAPMDAAAIRRAKDYFDFYLGTVAEYSTILAGWMRERGIDTPLIHNAANPKMNPYFLETIDALGEDFLLGSDHYYNLGPGWPQNNPTPQYAVKVFTSNEMLRLMGFPPSVLELPCGSASDWPPITPQDSRACTLANVALGMKGCNYYIFTGGPNPPNAGVNTDLYDYGAAIGAEGEVRPLYGVVADIGRYVADRPWLVQAQQDHDCRVALDFEYTRAHAYWNEPSPFAFSADRAWEFLQQGVLTTAFCASLSPSLIDVRSDDWLTDTATPLIVPTSSSMARAKQERIVRFLKDGGRALIGPVLPEVDDNLEPCTVLADFLGAPKIEKCSQPFVRVTVDGVVNIFNSGGVFFSDSLPNEVEVIGIDEHSGKTIAWSVPTEGGGQALFLGFHWHHSKHEHARMLAQLTSRLGLHQRVTCSNPNVWTMLRTAGEKSMLFLINLSSSPMEAEVQCRPGERAEMVDTGQHALGGMTVNMVELVHDEVTRSYNQL